MSAAPGAPRRRPPWGEVQAALEARGFRPSRRLGQNFLRDDNLARAIVRDSGVGPGDRVLEVGAGPGFLTLQLAATGARVLAVELDARLVEVAAELLAGEPQVELLRADVLAGKHALAPEVEARLPREGPWQLVSNLPYSAGSPLMVLLARRPNPPRSMTVMLQRELAERILAPAGDRRRGPFGLRLRIAYAARILRTVPPGAFWPRPEVDSAVARLDLLGERPDPAELAHFDALVELLFQQRRKAVGGLLAGRLGDRDGARALLADHGLAPRLRAEDLSLASLRSLAADSRWRGRGP